MGKSRDGRSEARGGEAREGAKWTLLWVVSTTHGRSVDRSTVVFFDDLPWVVFGGLRKAVSTGLVASLFFAPRFSSEESEAVL